MLAAFTLVGAGVLEMEGLELEPGVRWDFLSAAQWLSLPCQGGGSDPKLLGQKP